MISFKSLTALLSFTTAASGLCYPLSHENTVLMTLLAIILGRPVTCTGGNVVMNGACCALLPVLKDLQANLFHGGECGEDAHSALRLAFHDAIGFSLTKNVYAPSLMF